MHEYSTNILDFKVKSVIKENISKSTNNPSTASIVMIASYPDGLKIITRTVGDNKIWVSIDEATDVCGRNVANVVAGYTGRR